MPAQPSTQDDMLMEYFRYEKKSVNVAEEDEDVERFSDILYATSASSQSTLLTG